MKRAWTVVVLLACMGLASAGSTGERSVEDQAKSIRLEMELATKGMAANTLLASAMQDKLNVYAKTPYKDLPMDVLTEINQLLTIKYDAERRGDYYRGKFSDAYTEYVQLTKGRR